MAPNRLSMLPAELRNIIYELAFTPDDGTVDFRKPQPPTKDLLLACHQTYNEAAQIYREAYRKYWSDAHFVITNANDSNLKWDPKALVRIQNLEITGIRYWPGGTYPAVASRVRGGWNFKLFYDSRRGLSVESFQGTSAQSSETIIPYASADELAQAAERGEVVSRLDGAELCGALKLFN